MSQVRAALLSAACLMIPETGLRAEEPYKPGEVIEYKVGTADPPKWERGVIVKPLEGGKQYIIRQKPSEFFPEGSERAYSPSSLRRPAKDSPKPPANPKPGATPPPIAGGGETRDFLDGAKDAKGLLSEEDVLAYARKVYGGADREANEANMKRSDYSIQIRDYVKKHGTSFKASAIGKFYDAMTAQGTNSINIIHAINDNYGKHPKLEDYYGTFLLRSSNRGSSSVKPDGSGVKKIVVQDAQAESGRLTINRDGTYEWELLRGDPPSKWLTGKWREAKPDEMFPTEGGPAIWLESAKNNDDYMVRMDREVGYADWINVGAGKGRTPVEYGRRPPAKK
jgi:hypothetical protein